MSVDQWATTISGFLAVLIAVGAAFRWLIKHYLNELKPNGGSSMNDRLTKLEAKVEIIYDLLRDR
jgi:hypothetical protein